MEPKHSGLGIASFVTAIVSGILIFILTVAAGVIHASSPGGMDDKSPAAVVIGLCLIFFIFLAGGVWTRYRRSVPKRPQKGIFDTRHSVFRRDAHRDSGPNGHRFGRQASQLTGRYTFHG